MKIMLSLGGGGGGGGGGGVGGGGGGGGGVWPMFTFRHLTKIDDYLYVHMCIDIHSQTDTEDTHIYNTGSD